MIKSSCEVAGFGTAATRIGAICSTGESKSCGEGTTRRDVHPAVLTARDH
jgi:hypothetical protein